MDNKETRNDDSLTLNKETQINLVVNNQDEDEDSIDLVRVFQRFKEKSRVFVWLLIFCIVAGVSAALLMYQINKKPLTASSVVTLRYYIHGNDGTSVQVKDLTAPDGRTELDLSQITSSYVLQNAMSDVKLSRNIPVSALRDNITIKRIPTESSRKNQELIQSMMDNTSTVSAAYEKAQELEIKYSNQFIVSLTNGFGNQDENAELIYLEDSEIHNLLDHVLEAYNDYLVLTYGGLRLPDNKMSAIDITSMDIMEGLDLLKLAVANLNSFCNVQPAEIRTYRSWQTGLTLQDMARKAALIQEVNVDYLYSYIHMNGITKEPESVKTRYQYELRNAKLELDAVKAQIEKTVDVLANYKNDEILVSMHESDTTKSTRYTTEYYNELVLSQTENYSKVAELELTISNLQEKIDSIQEDVNTEQYAEAYAELEKAIEASTKLYNQISAHIEEILGSPFYRTFAEESVPQGKTESFLTASAKNMLLFGGVGAIAALAIWFFSALAPEFHAANDQSIENGKHQKQGDHDHAGKEEEK